MGQGVDHLSLPGGNTMGFLHHTSAPIGKGVGLSFSPSGIGISARTPDPHRRTRLRRGAGASEPDPPPVLGPAGQGDLRDAPLPAGLPSGSDRIRSGQARARAARDRAGLLERRGGPSLGPALPRAVSDRSRPPTRGRLEAPCARGLRRAASRSADAREPCRRRPRDARHAQHHRAHLIGSCWSGAPAGGGPTTRPSSL